VQDGRSATRLRHLEALFHAGTIVGLGDAQLLDRFASRRDEAAEVAFAALVERHGPMVLRVCREVLRDPHEAQDAFQATFLILARKSASIRRRDSLGPWLHGVALRVSACARSASVRRRAHERRRAEITTPSLGHADRDEDRVVLHEEIGRLPEKYRNPVVLCYLEGLTHDQAAQKLQWPVGTVRSRLSGARERLRSRLVRRGVATSAVILERSMSLDAASAAVPASLVDSTVRAVSLDAAGGAGAGLVSAHVAVLVQRGMRTMLLNKLSWTVAAALAGGLVALGAEGLAIRAMEKPPRASQPQDDRLAAKTDDPGRGNPPKSPRDEPDRPDEANGALPPIAEGAKDPAKAPVSRGQRSGRTPPVDMPEGGGGAIGASPRPGPGEDPKSLAVLKKLDEPVSMSFANETPLADVLAYIKSATAGPKDTGIPIYVDPIGLQEADITMTSPVTVDMEGVPLRQILYLLLAQLNLTYQVDHGFVFITAGAGEAKRLPAGPTPLMLLQDRAERGEMDARGRKQYIEMLKDLKEIKSLLYQLDHVEEIEASSARKGGTAGEPKPAAPGGGFGGVRQ